MNARSLSLLACALLLGACAPDPKPVVVLVYNPQRNAYEPRQVELKTVTDVVSLDGPIVRFLGGARFKLAADDQALATALEMGDAEKIRAAMTQEEGEPVEVSYIEREGVLVPADFDSLNLVTSYYNFERSFDFFDEVGGLDVADFKPREVHYFPEFDLFGEVVKDNALFFTPLQGFMVLPFESLQQIPLALNLGVVGHEFSHSVFNYRVFGSNPLPDAYTNWSSDIFASPGLNLLKSLDEGLADLFGTGITCGPDYSDCDPAFIGQSLSGAAGDERRIDYLHCLSDGLEKALKTQPSVEFTGSGTEYQVGSVLANALWRAATDGEVVAKLGAAEARRQLFEGAYKALGGPGTGIRGQVSAAASSQGDFRLETAGSITGVLDIFADSMTDPVLKSAVCSAFLDRFGATLDEMKKCPATARSFAECTR